MRVSRVDCLHAAAVEAMSLDVGRLRLQPLPGGAAAAVGAHGLEPHADLGEVDARRASRVAQRGQRLEEEQLRDVARGVGRVENRLIERTSELCIELVVRAAPSCVNGQHAFSGHCLVAVEPGSCNLKHIFKYQME